MSASCPNSDGDDLETSVAHDVNEGESQAAIEQEIQLHVQEPSCTGPGLVGINSDIVGEEEIVHYNHNGETNRQLTNHSSND